MKLSEELLEILACPQCKGVLTVDEENERLICMACELAYPVRDDIPIMLLDEAQPL